jgi:hypothetical protein
MTNPLANSLFGALEEATLYDWHSTARPEQLTPDGPWTRRQDAKWCRVAARAGSSGTPQSGPCRRHQR